MLGDDLAGSCSAETHEAALELTTGPHATVGGAVAELGRLRARLARDAQAIGLATAAAGMHPGEMAEDPQVSPAGALPGGAANHARDRPARADVRPARAYRRGGPRERDPRCSTACAPISRCSWRCRPARRCGAAGRPGLASNRTILFQAFPRTGLPRRFDGLRRLGATVDLLLRSGAIPEPTFLWWDARPQPRFGTVEVRIMDAQPRLEATGALCALVQALARLELEEGYAPRELVHAQEALAENRFLAARDGVAAELIDPVRALRVPVADVLADVLAAATPHADALGAADELAAVPALVAAPEAARQEAHAAARRDPRALYRPCARRFNVGERRDTGGASPGVVHASGPPTCPLP